MGLPVGVRAGFAVRRTCAVLLLLPLVLSGCAFATGSSLYISGTRALDRGETARAITDLEEAARLLPESSEVQNHLGIAYENAGRRDDALAAWRRAVSLDCSNAAAAKNLREAEAPDPAASVAGSAP